jgi:hypothetical protein
VALVQQLLVLVQVVVQVFLEWLWQVVALVQQIQQVLVLVLVQQR